MVTPLDGLRAALPGVEVVTPGRAGRRRPPRRRGQPTPRSSSSATPPRTRASTSARSTPSWRRLYPPADDPDALDELARVWDAGPQSVGGDRDSLRLHPDDEQLIRAVAAANPRTVVVVVAGAAVTMEDWRHAVPAILLAWYAGMEGGAALADVLLGAREPGGRLPFVVPRDEADLPPFDKDATTVTYDRWFGQRLLDRDGVAAAYPLGFGLSYTSFAIGDVEVRRPGPTGSRSAPTVRTPAAAPAATSCRSTRRRPGPAAGALPGRLRPGRGGAG